MTEATAASAACDAVVQGKSWEALMNAYMTGIMPGGEIEIRNHGL